MLFFNTLRPFSTLFMIVMGVGLTGCSMTQPAIDHKPLGCPILTTAGVVHVCPENKIAIIERGKEPKGLAMFGGHVEHESPEAAFRREAQEELSIDRIDNLRLIGVHGVPGRDPRQHSVEVTYACTTDQKPVAASDAKKVRLYPPTELAKVLESEAFAFDHKEILKNYLHNLQSCNPCKKVCAIGIAQVDLKSRKP